MNRKTLTFLVVSNRDGVTRRFVLPLSWVRAGIVVSFLCAIIMTVATVDYVGLLMESVQLKRLKAEKARLETQFHIVDGKLVSLEKSLERVTNSWAKLKMITNMDDPDRTVKLAMGPVQSAGRTLEELNQDLGTREDGPQREVASLGAATDDKVFLQSPPLDLTKNEVAIQEKDYSALAIRIETTERESNLREQGIIELWERLRDRTSLLMATPSMMPVRGWFTSRFGYRTSPQTGRPVMHQGLDIAANPGMPVHAPADGVVSFAGYDSGYGKLVSIDHGYGVVTRYGHNSKIYVKLGQSIRRGDVITAVGNTGQSTGPHLHYEVRINGVPVDPANYILDE